MDARPLRPSWSARSLGSSGSSGAEWLDIANPCLSLALVIIGLICILTRRRVIKQVIGLNIMLQGALLALIDAGRANGDMPTAQSMVISALVVEVIVVAIALALIVNIFRYHPEGRVDDLDTADLPVRREGNL